MFRTRTLASLTVSALGAMALQTLVAAEPAASAPPASAPPASTPPAQSIREWLAPPSPTSATNPAATPAGQAPVAGAPAGTTSPAQSIGEWRTTPGATPSGTTAPASSIREWMTPQSPALGPCATATPLANMAAAAPAAMPAAKPAAGAAATKRPITISFTSTLRQGNLVVFLDDKPIFNEQFQKPMLIISQTTRWDPLEVAGGKHKLSAKVYGTKKTYFSATYDLELSRTKGTALHFVMRGDRLTVELAS